MNLSDMSRDERSLLLYLETCAVDLCGRVDGCHMNEDDFDIAKGWNESGFVSFGRIVIKDHNRQGGNWAELSEDAWELAHKERRARQERNPRRYKTTAEKGQDSNG
ncbi:MAG: hypothetical protein V3U60_11285 [Gammaproteobacteria bacterium]